jgi:hypothetical protein
VSSGDVPEDFVPKRYVVADFGTPEKLLEGTTKLREKGHKGLDTHTPYPLHGLEEALGIRGVVIPKIVFLGGLMGILAAYSMMYFMNAVDFPINVANRPPHSAPAFVPITFELMVLLGGTSAFFGLMALMRLPQPYHPVFEWDAFQSRASIDGFFLSVEVARDDDPAQVADEVRGVGAREVQVIEEPYR